MKTTRFLVLCSAVFILVTAGLLSSCGTTATTYSYQSSSTSGDYAVWTLDSAKNTFSVVWTQTDNVGAASKTLTLSGTCGAANATFSYKSCTVSSSSDTAAVPSGATFDMLEIPGTAVLVHPSSTTARRGSNDEIHVGFIAGDCTTNPAGDYTYINTVPGSHVGANDATGLFGQYRVDSTFSNLIHNNFGLQVSGTTVTTVYNEGNANNGSETVTSSCSSGTRTLAMASNPSATLRGTTTASGLFLLDLPYGQGGIVSFKTTAAASLSDLSGKSIVGVSFGGGGCGTAGGCTQLFAGTFGTAGASSISIGSLTNTSGTAMGTPTLTPVSASAAGTRFTGVTGVNGRLYSNNALQATYATPSTIPGLFYTNDTSGSNETPTMIGIFKSGTRIMFLGVNASLPGSNNCNSNTAKCLGGNGNFIGFSK